MAKPPLDRFLRYAEFTAVLNELAAAYPGLLSLESIGRSHEGRDLWLCTLTNTAPGPAAEKPAVSRRTSTRSRLPEASPRCICCGRCATVTAPTSERPAHSTRVPSTSCRDSIPTASS